MYVDSVIHPVNLLPPNIFGFQVFMVSSASQQMVLVHLLLLLTECATRMGEQSYVLQGNHIQKLGGSLERPHFLASKAFPPQACFTFTYFLCRTISVWSYVILKCMKLIIESVDCLDGCYCAQELTFQFW